MHSSWKNVIKAFKVVDPPRSSQPRVEASQSTHPDLETHPEMCADLRVQSQVDATLVPETRFVCQHPHCGFLAKNSAGLAMHARRKHGIQTPLSLRLQSNVCPSCSLPFDTRDRALEHLNGCKRCKAYAMSHVDPMTPEELRVVLDREKGANYAWSRHLIPKSGPKPPGVRPPRNAVTPLFADAMQQDAATLIG
eukprot:4172811-Amphidinium_carterae.2